MEMMESIFCVNCGSASGSMVLEDEQILHCIQQWRAPLSVQPHDLICTTCWTEASQATTNSSSGGRNCALCKVVLPPRKRSHQLIALRTDTEHHVKIRNIILERLLPLQVRASHHICHPCWQRADRSAKHYSLPSSSRDTAASGVPLRCINCNIDVTRLRRHVLVENNAILLQVQQQITPRVATSADFICDACHTLISERLSAATASEDTTPIVGHQNICIICGRSLFNARSHDLQEEVYRHISHVVQNWVQPRQLQPSDRVCHRCYQRAEAALNETRANNVPQLDRIILQNYSRAPYTHARCMFPTCTSTSQQVVPHMLRVRLFSDHKYYIPRDCRICSFHLERQEWLQLFEETSNHCFTAAYIEDFCELLKSDKNTITFNDIDGMDENLFYYWLGHTKQQFRDLEAELPEFRNRATALGAYLMKLRTGDSDERISTLLNMSRTTLTKLLNKARDVMTEHFVPQHLGLQHISRNQIAEKNLYIPNALFGNPGSNIEDRKAIVIMDGTYIYVQKSSNYSYQKKTYSLHKYRNLVKPFLIVCCDGYIVDVLGPFPATKSDADILKDEVRDPSQPLRQYFKEGDIFILDRGFRDCIPILENLHYSVHYPLSLESGEYQMNTENANESRKVTLCRWVVEVVNGRFKRDFKLLRQDYFNKASKHLMADFKVAAALINRFHPLLVDRDDAREIVSVIQEKIFTNNTLAEFVETNNLNRKRANFESITVQINNLNNFPQLEYSDLILISLGVYQIKQARSYYGEHIRQDGNYIIEVCREVDRQLVTELHLLHSENVWLLRGKIHSRHISHKTYFVYVLVDGSEIGTYAIKQYCCNCVVGRRTIGCCAHVMTIIWYLSWARFQENLNPPAQFLDDILLQNIDEMQNDSI
ncbi:uncharacterized protein LOC135080779 [Ostrinia nubilalis]|uniref:uncharacterized protein LOC135079042 n=1 Tax=Ostrinia nubilalis TaxID=29057 RepID=UPI00308226BA